MSNTSDQTTKPSKTTRLIVGEVGVDTETGIVGKGHSYDNGKTFVVDDTIYGRIYHADDHGKIWKGIQDQVAKVVAPAKSAADSAQSTADAAVASAQVTSDAVTAIASATAEAKQGANEAMSRAESAWDVATGAKEAVTDFDPLVKSAQSDAKQANETAMSAYEQSRSAYDAVQADSSAVVAMQSSMADFREDVASTQSVADSAKADAGKALTQIADTANALSDAKTAFNSGVAEAKQLANTAQTTADSAVKSASENAKALASQANALSDAKKAMDSNVASATGLANAAQTTADNAVKSAASVASDLTAVASQAKSNADGITKVTSDVGLLQTTVADNSGNISKIQETATKIQQAVSDNSGNIMTAQQTADSAIAVASDAKSNVTVAVQTASGASLTATNAQSDATIAMVTASGAITQASDAKSNATIAVQTASEASVTATNAQGDASVAKQTASDASVQIKNAQGDISALQTRAGKIEASVATNSGAIANVQVTANELKASVSDNSGNITTAKQTADSAVTVASDAKSNATVAIQTASQASITASNASGQAASAVITANGVLTTASNAKSDATVAVQTASGASLTATNAQSDATIAKQTASEATVQASNAESDFAQLSIRANKIEANVATNSGAIASVQQTANGLTTTVANIKANGGGVNLANGTKSEDQSYGDASQTTGWQTPIIATFDNPQAGQQYTISVNTKTNGGSWRIQIWDGTSPTQRVNEVYGEPPVVAQEQKHTVTITWPSGSNKYLLVQLVNNNDGGQVFWNSAMIEEGTVAHTYSPAPGDLQTQFTQIKTSINGVTTIINDPKAGMTATYQTASQASLTAQNASGQAVTAVTTAQGAVTTAKNAQSDAVVAKQTASEASVTASNAAGDASVAKQTASQASISVKNAQSDITSLDARADSLEAFQKDASGNINKLVSRADGVDQTLTNQAGDISSLQSRAGKLESSMSTANGQISTLQQTANGLTTTVADIKANGGGVNLAHNTSNAYVIPGDPIGSKNIGSLSNDEWTALAGETITIGVTIEWTNWQTSGNNRIGFEVAPAKNGTGYWNNAFSLWCHPANGSSGKQRLTLTQTINNDIDGVTGGYAYVQGGCDTAKISELMIERGSVAHDWSPSPDDLQNQFTQIKQSINGVTTTINDPKTGLNATYQTAAGNSTTISNVKGDVTQLQTNANGLTSRVGNLESKTDKQQTAIDQNKTAITLKADQTTVNTLKGNVDQNTATLKTQADQIQAKVSASDVTGMLNGYATQNYAQSLVTQTADKWNLNLTNLQTDVNAIKTTGGGVNLANGTKSDDQSYGDASQTTGWRTPTIATFDNPQAGQQYTISVNTKTNGGSWRIQIWDGTSPTQRVNEVYGEPPVVAQEQKHIATITWPSGSNKYLLVQLVNNNDGGQIVWNSAMLEEGAVAHTWSPAPSDMATVTSVTNLSATVDGIKSTVATKADQSTVTQLSNALQSKVESSTYTSAINQLSNDINLRVKSADLISQINLQAGTTLIQSNQLVLDATTTVITGEAFIPSAAISSISADKVKIGNTSLFGSDGTFNLINESGSTASSSIKLTTGIMEGVSQPLTQLSNGTNTHALEVGQEGINVTPTIFFNDFPDEAKDTGWLGFSRHQTAELYFHTYDDTKELFRIACAARVNHDLHVDGTLWQQGLSITSGNTIWSGSDYLAIGDHISNTYTNVMARAFSSQSTLSSKTNIETVDPKDALDLVNRTDIRSYQYKTDVEQGKTKRYTSLIIDDVNDVSQYYAPDEFTNEERTGRDDGSAVGYLFLAVKELTRRIKILEEKLNG